MRVGKELLEKYSLTYDQGYTPREVAQLYRSRSSDEKRSAYQQKIMHSYAVRKLERDSNIENQSSLSWTNNRYISSHFEEYAFAIQEQEITTKTKGDSLFSLLPPVQSSSLCRSAVVVQSPLPFLIFPSLRLGASAVNPLPVMIRS